jgi:acetyl/propionyl-CoA carboxylase alpha subunit
MPDSSNSHESRVSSTSESSAASVTSDAKSKDPLASASSTPTNGPVKSQQETSEPGIKSSIGGVKGKESSAPYDGLINALKDKIEKTQKDIHRKKEANDKIEVSGTADMYKLANYRPTFVDEGLNWLRQKAIDKMQDPEASPSSKARAALFAEFSTDAWGMFKRGVGSLIDKAKDKLVEAKDKFFSNAGSEKEADAKAGASNSIDGIELTDLNTESVTSPLLSVRADMNSSALKGSNPFEMEMDRSSASESSHQKESANENQLPGPLKGFSNGI